MLPTSNADTGYNRSPSARPGGLSSGGIGSSGRLSSLGSGSGTRSRLLLRQEEGLSFGEGEGSLDLCFACLLFALYIDVPCCWVRTYLASCGEPSERCWENLCRYDRGIVSLCFRRNERLDAYVEPNYLYSRWAWIATHLDAFEDLEVGAHGFFRPEDCPLSEPRCPASVFEV